MVNFVGGFRILEILGVENFEVGQYDLFVLFGGGVLELEGFESPLFKAGVPLQSTQVFLVVARFLMSQLGCNSLQMGVGFELGAAPQELLRLLLLETAVLGQPGVG